MKLATTVIVATVLKIVANSTANNWKFNTIYRTCKAYTEGEIIEVI